MIHSNFNPLKYLESIDHLRLDDIRRARREHGYDSKIAVLRRIASHQVRTVKPTGWVWR